MKFGLPELFGLTVVVGSAYLMFGGGPLGAPEIVFLLVALSSAYLVLRSSDATKKSNRS
jgi:hypothetical protein